MHNYHKMHHPSQFCKCGTSNNLLDNDLAIKGHQLQKLLPTPRAASIWNFWLIFITLVLKLHVGLKFSLDAPFKHVW